MRTYVDPLQNMFLSGYLFVTHYIRRLGAGKGARAAAKAGDAWHQRRGLSAHAGGHRALVTIQSVILHGIIILFTITILYYIIVILFYYVMYYYYYDHQYFYYHAGPLF